MDADMVFARYLQEEEAAFASQIANDRNCARLLEEEEHVNDGVLPSDAERVLYKRMDERTRAAIVDHAHAYCPLSPHGRDVMKRRTGPCVVEEKPALILSDTKEAMFEDFQKQHPEVKIKFSRWKSALKKLVWNMKKTYRNDITNGKCCTPSRRIRSALEVAQHLRAVFSSGKWLEKHRYMKINEVRPPRPAPPHKLLLILTSAGVCGAQVVVMYIDQTQVGGDESTEEKEDQEEHDSEKEKEGLAGPTPTV